MSNNILHRAEIIYTRLYKEYDKYNNMDEFAGIFNITRQALYARKRNKEVATEQIRELFPQVNTEWLYSYDPEILKTAPVKKNFTNMVNDDPVPYQINPKSDVIQMLDAAEVLIRAARKALENHNNK